MEVDKIKHIRLMLGSSKYIWPGGIPQDLSTGNEPLTYIDSTHMTAVEVLAFPIVRRIS